VKIKIFSLLAALLLGSVELSAHFEESMDHRVSGGRPYLCVHSDNKTKSSSREPGIYISETNGSGWVEALRGELLRHHVNGGIFKHLNISKHSGAYEGMAIVNGELKVINLKSRDANPGSVLSPGVDEGGLAGPVLAANFSLPKINSFDDLSIFVSSEILEDQWEEVILVSQRGETEDSGYTYAFSIKLIQGENDTYKLVYGLKPYLIDYRFHSSNDLKKLMHYVEGPSGKSAISFISEPVALSYSVPRVGDSVELTNWRSSLADTYGELLEASRLNVASPAFRHFPLLLLSRGNTSAQFHVQTLDMLTKSLLPMYSVNGNSRRRRQGQEITAFQLDPLDGREFLGFNSDRLEEFRIEKNSDNETLLLTLSAFGTTLLSYVEDGWLNLRSIIQGTVLTGGQRVINLKNNKVKGFTQRVVSSVRGTQEVQFLITMVEYERGEGFLSMAEVELTSRGSVLIKKEKIYPFSNYSDLAHDPLDIHDVIVNQNAYIFIRPKSNLDVESDEAYDVEKEPMIDLLHLFDSGEEKLKFLRPSLDIAVTGGVSYREYISKRHGIDQKGLVSRRGNSNDFYAHGALIMSHDTSSSELNTKENSIVLASKVLSLEKGRHVDEFHVSVVALKNKDDSFHLYALVEGHNKPVQVISLVRFESPITNLHHLDLIFAFDSKSKVVITTLASMMDQTANEVEEGEELVEGDERSQAQQQVIDGESGMSTIDFVIELTTEHGTDEVKVKYHYSDWKKISDEVLLKTVDFEERLIKDKAKRPYLLLTPNRPETDKAFALYSFLEGEEIYPNDRKKTPKCPDFDSLFPEDVENEDEEKSSGFHRQAEWKVSNHKIEERNPFAKFKGVKDRGQFDPATFSELQTLLEKLGNPEAAAEHTVLLVTESLMEYVKDMIAYQWLKEEKGVPERKRRWNKGNYDLTLYMLQGDPDRHVHQEKLRRNLDEARTLGRNKRNILWLDMAGRSNLRPDYRNEEGEEEEDATYSPFTLSVDNVVTDVDDFLSGNAEGVVVEEDQDEFEPHLLYWIATEGRAIPLQRFDPKTPKLFSTLILATPEQWKSVEAEVAGVESERNLLESFSIVSIKKPSLESQVRQVMSFFNIDLVKRINLDIDLTGIYSGEDLGSLSRESKLEILAKYVVNRNDSYSQKIELDSFQSFRDVCQKLSQLLVSDPYLKREKRVDRIYIERIFTEVFSIPLNLETLPAGDPLRILNDELRAPFLLQQAGYDGPFITKRKIIQLLLRQTQKDPAKNIPSSAIIWGETGTGKTQIFKSLVKMLDLTLYDFDLAEGYNADAQAIIIDAKTLYDKSRSRSHEKEEDEDYREGLTRSVTEAIEALDEFRELPFGFRGFILIDDLHAAPAPVRAKLIRWIRTLQESKDNTQNLSLFVTLNPTDNTEMLEKYYDRNPTDNNMVIASLMGPGVDVDESFLMRWGEVMHFERFDAKAAALSHSLRDHFAEAFSREGRVPFFDPAVLNDLADKYEKLDARTFLSQATRLLASEVRKKPGHLSYLTTTPEYMQAGTYSIGAWGGFGAESAVKRSPDSDRMEDYVHVEFNANEISDSIPSKMQLLSLLINSFRMGIFESLSKAVAQDVATNINPTARQHLVTPTLLALKDHVQIKESMPLSFLKLDPALFALSRGNASVLHDAIENIDGSKVEQFSPLPSNLSHARNKALVQLLQSMNKGQKEKETSRRLRVFQEYSELIEAWCRKYFTLITFLDEETLDSDTSSWLEKLKDVDELRVDKLFIELYQTMLEFGKEFIKFNEEVELSPSSVSQYEITLYFLQLVEGAIADLEWEGNINYLVDSLLLISNNAAVGQAPEVSQYVFKDPNSIFRVRDNSLILQIIEDSPAIRGYGQEAVHSYNAFSSSCERKLLH